ncbi:VRR-NUC domain-containing protein [Clostridium sp. 19966]|uniref:VRR-NUC domain-containing protein n=1 Tax=Clostridium sp. 19966 TaxID=2768166 RepID=UPI0028DFB771|nr:VRR-NUC domain-containing protein [Clostridium sp. 19966]MDT8715458.1 VRR-NUC domain-containing protein [Clostridium sp. 19966]
MRENVIEAYLRDRVKSSGGKAYKFVSPGNTGVPDRLVLFPSGRIIFVELKSPGKKPTAIQLLQHKKIRALGFEVLVVDSKEQVDELIKGVVSNAI